MFKFYFVLSFILINDNVALPLYTILFVDGFGYRLQKSYIGCVEKTCALPFKSSKILTSSFVLKHETKGNGNSADNLITK